MDIEAYLDRIGYGGPRTPSLDTLRGLHRAHLLSVPFENLDVHARRPIILDRERLYDKIVRRRRGGFCYELNGLFAMLLGEMGFRVSLLSAGVARETGGFGPEFDHLALDVNLEGEWLADVGFGESIPGPLPFHRPGGRIPDRGGRKHVDPLPRTTPTLSIHALPARTGRFRGHVPLSSDLARKLFYTRPPRNPGHSRRARHAHRHSTDRQRGRTQGRTSRDRTRGIRRLVSTALRDRRRVRVIRASVLARGMWRAS